MSSNDRKQPRVSHLTFTIGGGREPSLRREVIVTVLLDIALAALVVFSFQAARTGGRAFFTSATQVLFAVFFAVHAEVPMWWRVYVKLRRGEDVAPWAMPLRVLQLRFSVQVLLIVGYVIVMAMERAKGLHVGQLEWLGLGVMVVVLWFMRGIEQAQVVGLPQHDGSAEGYGDATGHSEAGAERPDGM